MCSQELLTDAIILPQIISDTSSPCLEQVLRAQLQRLHKSMRGMHSQVGWLRLQHEHRQAELQDRVAGLVSLLDKKTQEQLNCQQELQASPEPHSLLPCRHLKGQR